MKETNYLTIKGFSIGVIAALILIALMGAVRTDRISTEPISVIHGMDKGEVALARNGRYQITSCSFFPGPGKNGGYGVFVVDTTTGVTKAAYVTFVDNRGKIISVNQLGRPFSRIKTRGGRENN
jgi:hypothetical protein